jgi:multidrug resistance efflux pump
MKSSFLAGRPRLRRWLPWALWGLTAAVAIPMALARAGIGSSPAVAQARVAALSAIRTDHRLRVGKILVEPGQRVKATELLVQMDTTEIDAELAVAQAKLAYVEIVAGWQQLRLQDDRARTSHALASAAERAAVDVARIVAEAERDRSELAQLDVNMALEQKLVGDQLASAERLKAMRLQRAALAKKVDEYRTAVAQARKSATGSGQRLGQWRQSGKGDGKGHALDESRTASYLAPPLQEDARAAAGALQRQEIARLELLRTSCEIRAPIDGRVGEISARVGELSADPATPIVTVVEEQSHVAIAYVGQNHANQVRVGDSAKLLPRDLSGPPLTGRVTALAPNITEIPERFRYLPTLREYGRNVYIQLDAPARLPGQAFDAVFHRPRGGGP